MSVVSLLSPLAPRLPVQVVLSQARTQGAWLRQCSRGMPPEWVVESKCSRGVPPEWVVECSRGPPEGMVRVRV